MADKQRWLREQDTYNVRCNVRDAEGIEVGDLIYMEPTDGFARPASALVDLGALAGNQQYFACRFLGVATQRHRASHDPADPGHITVGTKGIYEFDCAALAAALHLGHLFGVDENAAGTALLDQQVEQLGPGEEDRAIGILARPALAGDTTVQIKIISRVMLDSLMAGPCDRSSSSSGA